VASAVYPDTPRELRRAGKAPISERLASIMIFPAFTAASGAANVEEQN
jgi:hypothetical protein